MDLRGLSVSHGWQPDDAPGVALVIPPLSVETDDGPRPGVVFSAGQAREIAYALLMIAEQVDNGSVKLPPRPPGRGPAVAKPN